MMKLTNAILAAAACGLIGMMAPTLAQAQTVPAATPLPAPIAGPPAASSPASGPAVVRPPAPPPGLNCTIASMASMAGTAGTAATRSACRRRASR